MATEEEEITGVGVIVHVFDEIIFGVVGLTAVVAWKNGLKIMALLQVEAEL